MFISTRTPCFSVSPLLGPGVAVEMSVFPPSVRNLQLPLKLDWSSQTGEAVM